MSATCVHAEAVLILVWQEYAFSQYPRCAGGADCMTFARSDILFMGYSVRSDTMRYTEWRCGFLLSFQLAVCIPTV
jgi:hypothetical protein